MSNKSLGKCVYCGNDLFSESVHACKPAYPNCGACSGDGAICKKSCKLADESPSLQINPEQEPVAFPRQAGKSTWTVDTAFIWRVKHTIDPDTPNDFTPSEEQIETVLLALEKIPSNLYTTPPQRKPQFKEFIKWAGAQGYDCAQTCNSDTGEWIVLHPMTADLWKGWQAAHGIKE